MNYEGDLYGKVGGMVFKTGKTSKDWDNMEARLKELEAEILALKQANGVQASEATAISPLVSDTVCPYGHKYRRHWCTDCAHFDKCKIE